MFLTNNTWYTAKVVVEYQTSWPYANVLSLWVDTDGDADFSDETQLFYTGVTGVVGYVGVFRYTAATTVAQFDDVKIGTDNSSPKDGDFVGGMGVPPVNWRRAEPTNGGPEAHTTPAAISLSYDNNGNLTGGVGFQPARFRNNDRQVAGPTPWNRLVKATRRLDAKNTVATYSYDGLNRRIRVAPASCRLFTTNTGDGCVQIRLSRGLEAHATRDGTPDADGLLAANRSEHYYYAGWRVIEETDAATTPHTLAQTVYGTQYIDEPVCRDRNTDPTYGGSADNDCVDSSGSKRYFYHQDANFRVVALTDESAAVVERYEYSAYGEPRVICGTTPTSTAETGAGLTLSSVGNPLLHQGLRWDDETGLHENRMRVLHSRLGRFMQRDPAGYVDGLNDHLSYGAGPMDLVDPLGKWFGPAAWVRAAHDAYCRRLLENIMGAARSLYNDITHHNKNPEPLWDPAYKKNHYQDYTDRQRGLQNLIDTYNEKCGPWGHDDPSTNPLVRRALDIKVVDWAKGSGFGVGTDPVVKPAPPVATPPSVPWWMAFPSLLDLNPCFPFMIRPLDMEDMRRSYDEADGRGVWM